MIQINDLHASVSGKEILRGITLDLDAGEVHAIMGPNGSGKSTLAQVLAGHPGYEVTGGTVTYEGEDLLDMDPEVAIAKVKKEKVAKTKKAQQMRLAKATQRLADCEAADSGTTTS